jgi:hypothetical protein
MRVFVAQTRQPLADRNGQDGAAQNGRRRNIDEMSDAQAKQELAEVRNTIAQFRHHSSGSAAKDGTSSKEPWRT